MPSRTTFAGRIERLVLLCLFGSVENVVGEVDDPEPSRVLWIGPDSVHGPPG